MIFVNKLKCYIGRKNPLCSYLHSGFLSLIIIDKTPVGGEDAVADKSPDAGVKGAAVYGIGVRLCCRLLGFL